MEHNTNMEFSHSVVATSDGFARIDIVLKKKQGDFNECYFCG